MGMKNPRKVRVAVLVGGPSSEHDVSLASGRVVHANLDKDKYKVVPVLIGHKGEWPIEPKHLKAAVVNNDPDYLKKISGLGPKTAQRLIMELQNKVDYLEIGDMKGMDLGQEGEAMEALVALGYTLSQAKDALKEDAKGKTLEQRVREALKLLGKNRR